MFPIAPVVPAFEITANETELKIELKDLSERAGDVFKVQVSSSEDPYGVLHEYEIPRSQFSSLSVPGLTSGECYVVSINATIGTARNCYKLEFSNDSSLHCTSELNSSSKFFLLMNLKFGHKKFVKKLLFTKQFTESPP